MSWTDERVELLRQLWLDGKSASQISAALGAGLTRNAVIGKVHRLGLAGRAKTSSSSPSTSSGGARPSSGVRRTAAAPRASAQMSSAILNGGGGGGARIIRGNTALAMSAAPEAEVETQPIRMEEDVVVPMSLRVTIVDLKEAMCRWPLGDPTSADFRYCGSPAPGAGPYCAHHGKLAYQPMQDRRRERDRNQRLLAR
jgi:GcrA cell cycle regulator